MKSISLRTLMTIVILAQGIALPVFGVNPPYNTVKDWHPEYVCNYDDNGKYQSHTVNQYDHHGNPTRIEYYNANRGTKEPSSIVEKAYLYDDAGNILHLDTRIKHSDAESFTEHYTEDNEYNEYGKLTKHTYTILASEYEYMLRETPYIEEYEYDPVVHDYQTLYLRYKTENSVSKVIDGWKDCVERNDKGNVTKVSSSRFYGYRQGDIVFSDTSSRRVEYDENDNAIAIVFYDYYGRPKTEYRDIVWVESNGQYLGDCITLDFYFQADTYGNYAKSATKYSHNYYTGESLKVTHFEIEYIQPAGSIIIKEDDKYYKYVQVDEYGSSDRYIDNSLFISDRWDKFGTWLSRSGGDDEWATDAIYDDVTGFPLEYYTYGHMIDEDGEQINYARYKRFTNPGFDYVEIIGDSQDVAVYYDLSGRRMVGCPSVAGIYIRNSGGKSEKIIVK